MSFMDRFEETLQKGVEASKDLFEKAKEKTKDLSEMGILKYEIRQLENQVEKILGKLGTRIYKLFAEENVGSVASDNAEVQADINEITDLKQRIEEKESRLLELRKKS